MSGTHTHHMREKMTRAPGNNEVGGMISIWKYFPGGLENGQHFDTQREGIEGEASVNNG